MRILFSIALASSAILIGPYDSWAVNCRNVWQQSREAEHELFSNLEHLGIVRYGSGVFGDKRSVIGFLLRRSVKPFARTLSAYHELEVILTRESDYTTLVRALNRWLIRQKTGFQIILPRGIYAFSDRFVDDEDPALFMTRLISRPVNFLNGYIDPQLYPYMVRDGRFPLADPHDLLAHFPTLLTPDFISSYRSQAALTTAIYGWQHDNYRSNGNRRYAVDLDIVEHLMMGFLREVSHENLNFVLVETSGKKTFVVQGNKALHVAGLFTESDNVNFYELSSTLLFEGSVRPPGIFPETLSFYTEYRKERADLYLARNEELQKELGISSNTDIESRRTALMRAMRETVAKIKAVYGVFDAGDVRHEGMFFNVLAEEILKVPELKATFSRELRAEFWANTLALYRDYLEFAKRRN